MRIFINFLILNINYLQNHIQSTFINSNCIFFLILIFDVDKFAFFFLQNIDIIIVYIRGSHDLNFEYLENFSKASNRNYIGG